ncbi:MAG: hypothetical protein DRP47_10935, partial [Candidatus Zixiibacteriota bacterium]
ASYKWRARCYDGEAYSPWTDTVRFTVTLDVNHAPSPPIPQSPRDGSIVKTLQPTLIVSNGSDPDGDTLTYDFELYNEASDSLIASETGIIEGASVTQWPVPLELVDGTSYKWRARCYDGEAYSPWTDTVRFTVNLGIEVNLPPTLPTHYSPEDGSTIISTPIVLIIDNAVDPEGDSLWYDFRIYGDALLTQLIETKNDIPEAPAQTSVTLDFTPVNDRSYWWQVRVTDGENITEYTGATWFKYVSLITGGEETIAGTISPTGGQVILTDRPTLTAVNATVEGENSYFFEVATDSNFVNIVAASSSVPEDEDGSTSWRVDERLESDQDYYWRVRANDYAYSPVTKFHVAVDVYAAPNPVRLGETITFNLPDEPYDLLIQTVSGETVLIEESVSDEWLWNLNNASGNRVAIGVYLWYLTGTDARGKIVIKP